MGSLFRSEDMQLCQLLIQSEAAYNCVSELGQLGLVQFRDLNPESSPFQRKFINEVRRCEEMERKLRYMEAESRKEMLNAAETHDDTETPQPKEMADMEATFEKLDKELKEVNRNGEALKRNLVESTELLHVLMNADFFFDVETNPKSESLEPPVTENGLTRGSGGVVQFSYVTGVIPREKIRPFETMMWRASRGNAFLKLSEIESPLDDWSTGNVVFKSAFAVFCQGERLKTKVIKICEGFRATMFPCPEEPYVRSEIIADVKTRMEDLGTVLGRTRDHKFRLLQVVSKNINNWSVKVKKIKAVYHTLNLFNYDITKKCLIAECWVPVEDVALIRQALKRGTDRSGSCVPSILNSVPTAEQPPTFNRVNKFTSGFQNLVNAYGVSTYKEINPAPYTVITFPFLFAVMFGDVGHGLIVAAFGAWMVLREKHLRQEKSDNDVWNIFFGGRYIILLMGLFSIYTGFIYNDIFSKSMNVFGSRWSVNYNRSTIESNTFLTLDPARDDYVGTPYPFGMDPVWQLAENKIQFLNVYKMKISIIFGVCHMLFGVALSLKNYKYFDNKLDILATFIPQVLFLCFLFLYLVILVFIKWLLYSPKATDFHLTPYCAPSVLITFINMVLMKRNEGNKGCDAYMYGGQRWVQTALLGVALICVPWMLLAKPIVLTVDRKKKLKTAGTNDREEEEPLSEIYIHQGIHTVEYVLGSISHTASYLRLWALSLAHAQLSEVLWNMVLSKALDLNYGYVGSVAIWIVFSFWAVLTIAILVLMEGLSAFLHTLRLHWVEFQSKFYDGKGHEFQPFSFATITHSTGEDL